jgi:hypothetical protein
MRRFFLSTFVFLGLFIWKSAGLNAQAGWCGISQAEALAQKAFPDYNQRRLATDFFLKDVILRDRQNSTRATDTVVYTIPVVFHVLYLDPSENISTTRILTELANINLAFRNQGYYNPQTGEDVRLEFCLAKVAPDGTSTSGIERIETPFTDIGPSDDFDMKQQFNWDPSRYLNIYVARNLLGGGVAGYAYYPLYHGAFFDGIVLLTTVVGRSEAQSTTAVHEIGHYLGLPHPFDQGCENNDCLLQGDRVCDTPPDDQVVVFEGCVVHNNCTTDADDPSSLNPFTSDVNDRNDLYMDYNSNACGLAFTAGQVERMRAVIPNLRQSLLQSNVCRIPDVFDAGVVDIYSPLVTSCSAGDSIRTVIRNYGFAPISTLKIKYRLDGSLLDSVSWTGQLFYRDQDSLAFPLPAGLSAGPHRLEIWTDSPSGQTDQFFANDTASTTFNLRAVRRAPYHESFETGIPADWTVVNPDGLGWERTNRSCDSLGADAWAMHINNQYFFQNGILDGLVSPVIDLSRMKNAVLKFDYAYGFDLRLEAEFIENLDVTISSNCGESYDPSVFSASGSFLATDTVDMTTIDEWVPSACSDWRTLQFDLQGYLGQEIQVKFDFSKYENGFAFYLDHFRVEGEAWPVSIDSADENLFSIAPNPSQGAFRVISAQPGLAAQLELTDMAGRVVWKGSSNGDEVTVAVPDLAEGWYALGYTTSSGRSVKRVLIIQ